MWGQEVPLAPSTAHSWPSQTAAAGHRGTSGALLLRLLWRLVWLGVLILALSLLPWERSLGAVRLKHAILSLVTVVGLGKALLDTFFYDRYRP